jgi:hypothetical protein
MLRELRFYEEVHERRSDGVIAVLGESIRRVSPMTKKLVLICASS